MKGGIKVSGRIVRQITSEEGRRTYYDFKNYSRGCCINTIKPVIRPSVEDAREYLNLYSIYETGKIDKDRIKYMRYKTLHFNYDWRTQLTEVDGSCGLISPVGEIILPNIFNNVFSQFDSIHDIPQLIPVSNGNGWGLVQQIKIQ